MAGEENSVADDKTATKASSKGKLANFCEFLYNKKEGKVLGRTGRSWRKFKLN